MQVRISIRKKGCGLCNKNLKEFHFEKLTKKDCAMLEDLMHCYAIFDSDNYAESTITGDDNEIQK